MALTETAHDFFEACETGKGWAGCAPYCIPNASFSAEAAALDGITTLQAYADWMREIFDRMPDGTYEIKGFAADDLRGVVLAYAVFSGTVAEDDQRRRYSSNYVYSIQFEGDKIGHVTKIWNDTYS